MRGDDLPRPPADPVRVDEETRGLIPLVLGAFVGGPIAAALVFAVFVDPGLRHKRAVAKACETCAELKGPQADCSRGEIEDEIRAYRAIETREMPDNPDLDEGQLRAAARDMYLLERPYLIPLVAPDRRR
jgi:hypothetical protein